MAAQASGTKSLKEYLKRYETNTEEEQKKKRKKKKVKPDGPGVLVVDEDPVWQKPVKLEEEEDNDSADEKPQVDEDIEVKRMRRLEQLRSRRPYNTIAEDGSGWVSLTSKADATEQNSDMSPPRRKRYNTPSPEPLDRPSDAGRSGADFSPPRRRTHHHSPSPEPHTRSQHFTDLNSDLSPPRKQRARNDTHSPDPSLKPRSRESNLSPVRRRKHHYSPSPGPDTKHKYSGSPHADLSPPRRQRETNYTSSPPARRKEDDDFSPPRQQRRRHYTPSPEPLQNSDMSPPRRSHAQTSERRKSEVPESGVSHPRRADHKSSHGDARTSLGSDLSPPRKRRMSVEKSGSPDFSSQHLSRHSSTPVNGGSHAPLDQDVSLRRKNQESSDPVSSKGRAKTGLITGHDIMEEISKTKKDDLLRFEQMDPSLSGRGAEPVFRDKKGQRISKEEYMKSKQKVEEKPKEKKLEWGKGLAQKREAEARLLELEQEKDKPFARTRDDAELDKMMKERVRWGDPMAHLVKNKHSGPVLADLGDGEKMKESGFIVPQEIPSHSWIKRGLDAAPNRYGIKPGRHWDGVDRSNGFEKKMFQRLNEKRATEREAYLWSVSDM